MPATGLTRRLGYFAWSAAAGTRQDTSCPCCGSADTVLVKRKFLVTTLRECGQCHLRFRWPKDDEQINRMFYQEAYKEGFTSDCPSDEALRELLAAGFAGHEKDYSHYVAVLKAAGVRPGDRVLDFGCSWGYGSYQLKQAGFDVTGYEISEPRGRYASQKLGVNMVADPVRLAAQVDCVFSAHVMEHLPAPGILWNVALASLREGGLFIAFVPNGDPARETLPESREAYHALWGQAHPLMITAAHLDWQCRKYGFNGQVHTDPYDPGRIASGTRGELSGDELCLIARRTATVDAAGRERG